MEALQIRSSIDEVARGKDADLAVDDLTVVTTTITTLITDGRHSHNDPGRFVSIEMIVLLVWVRGFVAERPFGMRMARMDRGSFVGGWVAWNFWLASDEENSVELAAVRLRFEVWYGEAADDECFGEALMRRRAFVWSRWG